MSTPRYELTLAALAKDLRTDVEVVSIGRHDLRAFLRRVSHRLATMPAGWPCGS